MNCWPLTWIVRARPLGGLSGPSRSKYEEARSRPLAGEFGGLRIGCSSAKVSTASAIRIAVAPSVQPISRRVLPWICTATRPLRLRKRTARRAASPRRRRRSRRRCTARSCTGSLILLAFGRAARSGASRLAKASGAKTQHGPASRARRSAPRCADCGRVGAGDRRNAADSIHAPANRARAWGRGGTARSRGRRSRGTPRATVPLGMRVAADRYLHRARAGSLGCLGPAGDAAAAQLHRCRSSAPAGSR